MKSKSLFVLLIVVLLVLGIVGYSLLSHKGSGKASKTTTSGNEDLDSSFSEDLSELDTLGSDLDIEDIDLDVNF